MRLEIITSTKIPPAVTEQFAYDTQKYFPKHVEIDILHDKLKVPDYYNEKGHNFFEWDYAEIKYGKGLTEDLTDYDGVFFEGCGGPYPNIAKLTQKFHKKRELLEEWLVVFVDQFFSYLPEIYFAGARHGIAGKGHGRKSDSYFHNFSLVGDLDNQILVFGGSSRSEEGYKFKPVPLKFNGWIFSTLLKTLTNKEPMLDYITKKGARVFEHPLVYMEEGYVKNLIHNIILGKNDNIVDKTNEAMGFTKLTNQPVPGVNCPPEE